MNLNILTETIIGAAITVHKELGPGLLESVYQSCLYIELVSLKLKVCKEVALPVTRYFGVQFMLEDLLGTRVDLVTDKALRAELRPFIEKEAIYV